MLFLVESMQSAESIPLLRAKTSESSPRWNATSRPVILMAIIGSLAIFSFSWLNSFDRVGSPSTELNAEVSAGNLSGTIEAMNGEYFLEKIVHFSVPSELLKKRSGRDILRISYIPRQNTTLPPMWRETATSSLVKQGNKSYGYEHIFQLRPKTSYDLKLWLFTSDAKHLVASSKFRTLESNCSAFDSGPVANVTNPTSFYWKAFIMPFHEDVCGYEGFVALDREGYVVWTYEVNEPGPIDQLEHGEFVIMVEGVSWMVQKKVVRMTPAGKITMMLNDSKTEGYAFGDGNCTCLDRCVYYNHEIRTIDVGGREAILTMQSGPVQSPFGPEGVLINHDRIRPDLLVDKHILLWYPTEQNSTTLFKASEDFAIVPKKIVNFAQALSVTEIPVICTGKNGTAEGDVKELEWWHTSAVSKSYYDGTLIISFRNLNTIASFNFSGAGLNWVLSSSLDSDYSFVSDSDKFYNPHAAYQIESGEILLMDDGSTRPGCYNYSSSSNNDSSCWSRMAMYKLEETEKVAHLVRDWKHQSAEGYTLFNSIGGDVYNHRVSGDKDRVDFFVAFMDSHGLKSVNFFLEQITWSGTNGSIELAARMEIQRIHQGSVAGNKVEVGLYRAIPLEKGIFYDKDAHL